jgi:DNA modification methylase
MSEIEIKSKEIKIIPIEQITEHPKNANRHSIEQIERLCKLIRYQGFRSPLIISKRSGFLVSGHGRKMAAEKLGLKELPCVYQDFENEAQEYAYVISENEIARWAELDKHSVYTELKDLDLEDIELLGLEDFELPDVEELDPQTDEDEVPEVENPITVRGDVWLLGKHRLMCGDSTMIDDVEKLMAGEKADMVFTDPPYGYSYESNHQDTFRMLKNDDKILDFLPNANASMADNSTIYLCGSHQTIDQWKPLVSENFDYRNMIVWKKNNWSMGSLKRSFAGQHELILFASKGKQEIIGKRDSDIWEFNRVPPELHPTMKPVELISYALSKFQSGSVIDFFGGSGSTMIACEKDNKTNYSMELDEKYCDVMINRWQNYTGKKATLEATGQTYEELCNERK